MKISHALKFSGLLVLSLGLTVGCATQPKPAEPAPQEPVQEEKKGPSAAVLEAIAAAKAAIAEAKAHDALWRDTAKILAAAEKAAAAGDDRKALKLANQARRQAELSLNQRFLSLANDNINKIEARKGSLSPAQLSALGKAKAAYDNYDGKRAYELSSALLAEILASNFNYTVERGDNLWSISAKDAVYANPYQWPLIYKANRDKIKDADLIYPGQEFDIVRNPSASDIDAAVSHARNRGAWAIGTVEATDRAYLAK